MVRLKPDTTFGFAATQNDERTKNEKRTKNENENENERRTKNEEPRTDSIQNLHASIRT